MRILVALSAGALLIHAQVPSSSPGLDPDVLLLTKIRAHMQWNLQRQPNYTCVETVERSRRSGAARKFQLQDTLRMEVALVDGKEMFAWPGSRKFEQTDLRAMVSTGTFGNGNFALHARAIFQSSTPTFEYRGEWPLDGQTSIRYDYRVPLFLSGYLIRVAEREATVGYHGSIYADPETLDIRRIQVIADEIPIELGLAETTDTMDYGRMPIGDAEFLLPLRSQLTMTDLHNQESRNDVRFTSCRQFTGESVLSFGDPPPETPSGTAAVQEVELPAGLSLTLSLLDTVDVETFAVGDPVRASLSRDLRLKGRLLFSKGSVATGRLTRLERRSDSIVMGIEFTELESPGIHARLQMKFENVVGIQFIAAPRRAAYDSEARPGEAVISLRSGTRRLNRGILISWRT